MKNGSRVFISYSHQDNLCAIGIAKNLKRKGFDVWIDSEQLTMGEEWATNIDCALDESDTVIAILSASSVRRREVLREISVAIDKMKREKRKGGDFFLLFVVLGTIHPTWFSEYQSNNSVKEILEYLSKHQFVQLDARGTLTISFMQKLASVLNTNSLRQNEFIDSVASISNEKFEYINKNGIPEKIYDNKGQNCFYKVRPNDLAHSTVFPFALDNQWLPDPVMTENSKLKQVFLHEGFASETIKDYMTKYQHENFYQSLFHSRQIILNRASILNCVSLNKLFIVDRDEEDKNFWKKERAAFKQLLNTGVIVVFLYGDYELSPFVNTLPKYTVGEKATRAWNKVCRENRVYCIREDWDNPVDQHSIELLKYCTTLSVRVDENIVLASIFGLDPQESEDFLRTLRDIEMQVFCQTHMNGTSKQNTVTGYSRSSFYKNFIVKDSGEENDPVLYCLLDNNKPFSLQLKKMIDVFYNSIFSNCFNCWPLMPNDARPEDTFLHQLYLQSGDREVSLGELQYAFSELFEQNRLLELIETIGDSGSLDNWTLDDILKFRRTDEWHAYIELLELINQRNSSWKTDFDEVELLVKRFADCVQRFSLSCKNNYKDSIGYSFRACLGSKVLDIVCTRHLKKLRHYIGSYKLNSQNTLSIQFQIGDLSSEKTNKTIFLPVVLFNGKTDSTGGETFFNELCSFLVTQHSFVWVNA